MIVHRFMSNEEYRKLMRGETLRNITVQKSIGNKSDSIGFCFFTEPPEEAIHWLSFIVNSDWCVTLEIPDGLLTKSKGRYRDVEKDRGRGPLDEPAVMWRTEWCLQKYSLRDVRVIEATDKWKMYGKIPEGASFFEVIERLRTVGQFISETEHSHA